MAESRWTEAFLNEQRLVGDAVGDDFVDTIVKEGHVASTNLLLGHLVRNDIPPGAPIETALRDYLDSTGHVGSVDFELVKRGEQVLASYAPQIALSLCFGSLAGGYASYRIAHMLDGVSRLESDPRRRVFETAQLLFDVCGDDGFGPDGRGIRSCQRIRLMHAGVRRLMRDYMVGQPDDELVSPLGHLVWARSWGVAINQEDMAGTISTMSVHVVDCLRRLGVRLSDDEAWAYVYTWLVAGRVIGVSPEMTPVDLADARQLWARIQERQFKKSDAGKTLTDELLWAVNPFLGPGRRRAFGRGLITRVNGPDVAAMVGIDPLSGRDAMGFRAWMAVERGVSSIERRSKLARRVLGSSGASLVRNLAGHEMGHQRAAFAIPDRLAGEWNVKPPGEDSR